jgi:hypothetical protein
MSRFTKLPVRVGLVFLALYALLYGYAAASYYIGGPRDQVLMAAFLSAPGSLLVCQVAHSICVARAPSGLVVQWLVLFVVGAVQWFVVPAFVCWLLFDSDRPLSGSKSV